MDCIQNLHHHRCPFWLHVLRRKDIEAFEHVVLAHPLYLLGIHADARQVGYRRERSHGPTLKDETERETRNEHTDGTEADQIRNTSSEVTSNAGCG